MADIHQEIRDWLHQQPDWLQEVAELLLSTGAVSDADVQRIAERLKTPEGQKATSNRTFGGLTPQSSAASGFRLVEIGDIHGIENLGPRGPLSFGKGNLSVIYGHNGSGKSGYSRLLKKACGKPRAKELRTNVFQPPPAVRKCRISYEVKGLRKDDEWPANGAPIEALRGLAMFDADVSLAYLTQETAASYTPPTVALFEGLVAVCDRLKNQLQVEQSGLVSKLPVLPPEYAATPAGITYGKLTPTLGAAALQGLSQWQEEDRKALTGLTERLATHDPATAARTKRGAAAQLKQLAGLLRDATNSVTDQRITAVRALRADALAKRRIADESAHLESVRLDGIGTATWRALWSAARVYSQTAYPGKDFPVTQEALCVLCQQELGGDAQRRLRDFDAFVQGRVEADAKAAEQALQGALAGLPDALNEAEITMRCQAAGLTEAEWVERLGKCWSEVAKARAALLGGEVTVPAVPVEVPLLVLNEMSKRADALELEAIQHAEDAKNFDRAKATKDKLSLEARRWTSQQADAIQAEIGRLQKVAEYETWKRAASSQRISVKAGAIAERVITGEFVARFNRELKALGASRIRVELVKTRNEKGKALHKILLKGAQVGQDLPDSVLSDGERRIVGLAGFLADVVEQHSVAPFVFDDPISSLDHDFEWSVAVRLVELAQTRQVVVFTHRLSLYGALEDAAKKIENDWKKQHLHQQCIESFAGIAGQPVEQAAWNGKTTAANNTLLTRLNKAKKEGEISGAQAYRNLAQGICSDFRKLLERTVEDDLLNEIVKRHRRSVTTDNRLAPLAHIRQADCKFIDDLMTKYSCYEHSQSSETPVFVPEEAELRNDLEDLKKWREDFKNRPTGNAAGT